METKETQTPKTFFKDKTVLKKEVMQSKGTQYVKKAYKDANVQYNIDSSPSKDVAIMDETLDDSVISKNDLDTSYSISDDNESNENDEPRTATSKSRYAGYVEYWSCISILFKYCLSCGCLANVLKVCTRGSRLIVELFCYKGHKTFGVHNKSSIGMLLETLDWLQAPFIVPMHMQN